MRQQLNSLGHARAGPGKIRVRIHSVYRSIDDLRQAIGDNDRILKSVPARRNDYYLGIRCGDVVPGDASRVTSELTKRIVATGGRNHFRHPVTGAEQRLGPLEKSGWPRLRVADCLSHTTEPSAVVVNETPCCLLSLRRVADRQNVLLDFGEVARRERQHLRRLWQIAQSPAQLVP